MRRRDFFGDLGALALWPLVAQSQALAAPHVVAIALGSVQTDAESHERIDAFRMGLQALGWAEGRNVRFEYRWMGNSPDLAKTFALEIVALKPDVILCSGTVALNALSRETTDIPIVFVNVTDPVAGGFVRSLSRPGGNITGFTPFEYPIAGKWLELLKVFFPRLSRAALLGDPNNHNFLGFSAAFLQSASRLSVEPVLAPVRTAEDIEQSLTTIGNTPDSGVVVTAAIYSLLHRPLIVRLASEKRIPAIYWSRFFPSNGGLMSYGPNTNELHRQSANYVDCILRGATPARLPIQEATTFESVLNLKVAKNLGLMPSPQMLLQIDEVLD